MGWDAFGLPTEQTAIESGIHPRDITSRNIDRFRVQFKRHGFAIDWNREVNTTDPGYFKWTQWIFLQLFKHGLAYVDEKPVWWCEALGTVLANEEVIDGLSERGNHPVVRRNLRQWVLRITAYAERLLEGHKNLDWPASTIRHQASWIGRSEGAEIVFALDGHPDQTLTVFTTRPDTLFGATYMVIAPEHPLVGPLTIPAQHKAVSEYVEASSRKSDLDRTDLAKEKSGVFTGSYAINPVSDEKVPIWIADYVLMSYGTGAIMAVPAHDERDHEFATEFGLPITTVIERPPEKSGDSEIGEPLYTGTGTMVNSGAYDGLPSAIGIQRITDALEAAGKGRATVNYKLRDWLFSRQRYWGEPFPVVWVNEDDYKELSAQEASEVAAFLPTEPVVFEEGGKRFYSVPVPPSQIPLCLPETESYQPSGTGESPLANIEEWVEIWFNTDTGEAVPAAGAKPDTGHWVRARRETNTMPQWAGSSWYHIRYCDPVNTAAVIDPPLDRYWGSPDIYVGGPEHTVTHLLYARFWHHFLHDIGVVADPEPYQRLVHQGMILGEDGEKMSKRSGSYVDPDAVIDRYGADSLRLYIMFMGPLSDDKPWNSSGIEGVHRFLRKAWRGIIDREGKVSSRISEGNEDPSELNRVLHETIKKVTEDIENLRFNTAISQLMIFVNQLQKTDTVSTGTVRVFLQLLAPFAPHIAEELWERMGGIPSISERAWPEFDASVLVSDEVKIVFQVNGKYRGDAMFAADASQSEVATTAQAHTRVRPHLEGKTIRKVIFVPGKILNIVAK